MAVRGVVAVLVAAAAATTGATPAFAQGAPSYPVSRAVACAPDGGYVNTPPCQAAVRAGAALREWDNIRVYGVNGRDRERIPDGELCSGGLSAYQGLNLARTDWPTTRLAAGAPFTARYRSTVGHQGVFRLYLTRAGYTPAVKLTWADLETLPFLRVANPPLVNGEYQLSGRLPADRAGRHVIYTIWQHSDSADTYYSCSDVDIVRPGAAVEESADVVPEPQPAITGGTDEDPAAGGDAAASGDAATGGDAAGAEVAAGVGGNVPVAAVTSLDGRRWPLLAGVVLGMLLLVLLGTWLRGSRTGPPPGRPCTVRNHRANPRVW